VDADDGETIEATQAMLCIRICLEDADISNRRGQGGLALSSPPLKSTGSARGSLEATPPAVPSHGRGNT
jgi:hypothetical protein